MLHSLLEEKALKQASQSLEKDESNPEVQALARDIYQGLIQQFSSQVDENYASDAMMRQRAAAREGINQATKFQEKLLVTGSNEPLQTLVPRSFFQGIPVNPIQPSFGVTNRFAESYLQLPPSIRAHISLDTNRYGLEYEEIEIVGKGGYGKVYKVKHKLDNAYYAVKRINISAHKIKKLQERGNEELQCILEEVRSLARFEHNNIVRYHAAWMEFCNSTVRSGSDIRSDRLLEAIPETSFDSTGRLRASLSDLDLSDPFDRSRTDLGDSIVFEASNTDAGAEVSASDVGPTEKIKENLAKNRRGSQATIATISSTMTRLSAVEDAKEDEEGIETIPRDLETTSYGSESMVTDSDISQHIMRKHNPTGGPVLILNVQMSLYESNLATFLTSEQNSPGHCFHVCISLEILNKIMKGVEYLHDGGVVHRDLKPANIFLGLSTARSPPAGSVNLSSCSLCKDRQYIYVTPKIGDFGLVAALGDAASKPVGTELYRPAVPSNVSGKLDVYALGVVAFEMLHKFGTHMERIESLMKLRHGEFPENFVSSCDKALATKIKEMVGSMIAPDDDGRWTCEEVRKKIAEIVSALKA